MSYSATPFPPHHPHSHPHNTHRRYEVGLDKLASTESQVKDMQVELEALQPKLIVSTKETDELMVVIETQTVEADKVKAVVQVGVSQGGGRGARDGVEAVGRERGRTSSWSSL